MNKKPSKIRDFELRRSPTRYVSFYTEVATESPELWDHFLGAHTRVSSTPDRGRGAQARNNFRHSSRRIFQATFGAERYPTTGPVSWHVQGFWWQPPYPIRYCIHLKGLEARGRLPQLLSRVYSTIASYLIKWLGRGGWPLPEVSPRLGDDTSELNPKYYTRSI